jgi:ABC-type lipoprotein release transport system permease subunit
LKREGDQERSFGALDYITRRLRHYWIRNTFMVCVIALCVIIFLIVLSLLYGLYLTQTVSSAQDIPLSPESITRRRQISQGEANTLVSWLVVTVVLLFISSTGIVFNTLRCSVLSSKRDIAILGSMGLSGDDVSRIFYYEAAWLALVSWAAGFLVGLLISNQLFQHLYYSDGRAMFFAPARTMPEIAIASFVITMLVAYLGAKSPATRAARIDPVESLR